MLLGISLAKVWGNPYKEIFGGRALENSEEERREGRNNISLII
jgi:hypothetical protein